MTLNRYVGMVDKFILGMNGYKGRAGSSLATYIIFWSWLIGRSWIFGVYCECSNRSSGKGKCNSIGRVTICGIVSSWFKSRYSPDALVV